MSRTILLIDVIEQKIILSKLSVNDELFVQTMPTQQAKKGLFESCNEHLHTEEKVATMKYYRMNKIHINTKFIAEFYYYPRHWVQILYRGENPPLGMIWVNYFIDI